MKRTLWVVVCGLISLFLLGALAVETVNLLMVEPRTVGSIGEVFGRYLDERGSLPPLPLPKSPNELIASMESRDFSFLNNYWYVNQSSVLYVADDSELAKTITLPLEILAIEDICRGEIIIFCAKNGQWEGLALFNAPPVLDETDPLYKSLSAEEKEQDLCFRFNESRIRWSAVLKSETDAWADLLRVQKEAIAFSAPDPVMMAMSSAPTAYTNDIWLHLETLTNSIVQLQVFAPTSVSNVEVYATGNLVSNVWTVATEDLHPGPTNPATWNTGGADVEFYAAGNMDIDTDSDLLCDGREKYVHKTDPDDSDTDGDNAPDGWEVQHEFDPLDISDGSADPDADGLSNYAEYVTNSHPMIANVTAPSGAGRIIYQYDDDGRLTGAHCNNTSAVWYVSSPAHNLNNVNVYTD